MCATITPWNFPLAMITQGRACPGGGLTAVVKTLRVGNGVERGVTQGPLIDASAVARSRSMSRMRWRTALAFLCGGNTPCAGRKLLRTDGAGERNTRNEDRARSDVGPVAALFRFTSKDEVIALANDTEYGFGELPL
ncbi:aldehyde dehydrogenase family protein [Paraburkholderia dipogonis]|uniref:aldehyde dehydrogenase family protein n=1 Tax=Paraburkholderia dipogonis TaxID=1211383 RepID=UPI0035EDC773